MDPRTLPNVAVLAKALADPYHADQHFLFVGHADLRGSAAYNMVLSKHRADSMSDTVTVMEPSLRGPIERTGKGSLEPTDIGSDEEALRANRLLQVLLR